MTEFNKKQLARHGVNMKLLLILTLLSIISACASKPTQDKESENKITVTGTRIKRSELPPGPKLKMSINRENKSSNIMQALADMQNLPQPKDIGNCSGLISALSMSNLKLRIIDSNNAVLKTEHGIYEYSFDDESCPTG